MTQYQILSARRGADQIGLHKPQPVESAFQLRAWVAAVGDGESPRVVKGHQHAQMSILSRQEAYS